MASQSNRNFNICLVWVLGAIFFVYVSISVKWPLLEEKNLFFDTAEGDASHSGSRVILT